MGYRTSSLHFRGADRERLLTALRHWVAGRTDDVRLLVSPAAGAWTGVFPSDLSARVGESIAAAVGGVALLLTAHDVVMYALFDGEGVVDRYCSEPDYFGPATPEERAAQEGRPELLARLAGRPDQAEELTACLRRPFESSESNRVATLKRLLEIENLGARHGDPELEAFEHVPDLDQVAAQREAKLRAREQAHRLAMAGLEEAGWLLGEIALSPNTFLRAVARGPGGGLFAVAEDRSRVDLKSGARTRLMTLDPPWSELRPVTGSTEAPDARADITETGQTIQVVADPATRRTELVVSDLSTGAPLFRQSPLDPSLARGRLLAAALDASGRWLVASVEAGRQSGLHLFDRQGGPARMIARRAAEGFFPPGMITLLRRQAQGLVGPALQAAVGGLLGQAAQSAGRDPAEVSRRAFSEGQLESVLSELESTLAARYRRADPPIYALAFTADGSRLCAGTSHGFHVYRWASLVEAAEWPEPERSLRLPAEDDPSAIPGEETDFVYSVAADPRGASILFGGRAGAICRWDPAGGDAAPVLRLPEKAVVLRLAFSGDGAALAVTFRLDEQPGGEDPEPQRLVLLNPTKLRG